MTIFVINPGAGHVSDGTRLQAERNVRALINQAHLPKPTITIKPSKTRRDGRWVFVLTRGRARCTVDMPGIPWSQLGITRLYVDGNSWMWKFAVEIVRDVLADHDGTLAKANRRRERAARDDVRQTPTCSVCGGERSVFYSYRDNPPGVETYRADCEACQKRRTRP